jgi:hypothetical protein
MSKGNGNEAVRSDRDGLSALERAPDRDSTPPSSRAPAPLAKGAVVVVPFPSPLVALSEVRSTLLLSSLHALRSGGYFDAYEARVPSAHREEILGSMAGAWLPAAAALAHYRACDALGITSLEQMALGRQTGNGLRHHLTRAAAVLSRGVGVSPWIIFEQFDRFWARSFKGGGVSVIRRGPKDAEIVFAKCALLQSPYFRSALRGVALGLLEVATRRSFMSEMSFTATHHEARYRLSWV